MNDELLSSVPEFEEKPEPCISKLMIGQGFQGELLAFGRKGQAAVFDGAGYLQAVVACICAGKWLQLVATQRYGYKGG